jgi:hypothetical protein
MSENGTMLNGNETGFGCYKSSLALGARNMGTASWKGGLFGTLWTLP